MSDVKLTDSQERCLRAVVKAGSVVLQSGGRGLASGEWLPFMPETYLRLLGDRMLCFKEGENRRLVPTHKGRCHVEADEK